MKIGGWLWLLGALSLAACGGEEKGASGPGSSSSGAGTGGEGGGGGAGGAGGAGGMNDGGAPSADAKSIAINEIYAAASMQGANNWIEMVNTSDADVDLSGYGITDADTNAPQNPDIAEVVRFPGGAVIPGGSYIIILLDQDQAPNPPVKYVDCIPGSPSGTACYDAGFKVSATGERVFFVDPKDIVVSAVDYPDPAVVIPSPVEGQTWSRLPDKTGNFGIGVLTPGGANMSASP